VLIADRTVLREHPRGPRLASVEAPLTPGATPATVRDPALIGRLLAGDDAALADVYADYGALVYGLARSVSHDEQIARDVTQDVFVHLWEFPDRVDLTRGSLKSYLAVIAHRRAVDAVRRSERRARTEERMQSQRTSAAAASDSQVLNESARIWQSERLAALVDDLPREQGDALRLAYFEGRTYREVAVQLGIPEGTAKSRLRLALARLREQLDRDDRWAWT
jgi:RNA polymerase sigma-70 factor (ECF subfamily)